MDARIPNGSTLSLAQGASRHEAVAYLSHLTHPPTRHVLLAVNEQWTAVLNNNRTGSDFADYQGWFGRLCDARTVRVVDSDDVTRRIGDYVARVRYPARIFELADPDGQVRRSISCALDGDRWAFDVHGDPLPAEASFDYAARRRRDRFTSENLLELLASLGAMPSVPDAFTAGDRFVALAERITDSRWAAEIEARACTPEQADDPGYGYFARGRGFAAHLRTHAESVVGDMTRATLLNPGLMDDARPYLEAARDQLGPAEFSRLTVQAEMTLRRSGG